MLNSRGQVFFYTLMLAIVVVVLGLALVIPVNQTVESAMQNDTASAQGLDCSNSSISAFQKSSCVITDLATPYYLFGMIAIASMIIGAKLIIGGLE